MSSHLESIFDQLQEVNKRRKPKLLVVDDEPDNLDLLYRTFRRHFQVLRAESGVRALEVLAEEGEVAVIISDQRMPEMKGTEFLSKTVPQFPHTVRIILTGFTDVEDLVDAINSGQVYKYITKPWDPQELKQVVAKARETHEILKERLTALEHGHSHAQLMTTILQTAQNCRDVDQALKDLNDGFVRAFNVDFSVLQLVENQTLVPRRSVFKIQDQYDLDLTIDPITQTAIASEELEVWIQGRSQPIPEDVPWYGQAKIAVNLVIPVLYQKQVMAVLAMMWLEDCDFKKSELEFMSVAAQQISLALMNCPPSP